MSRVEFNAVRWKAAAKALRILFKRSRRDVYAVMSVLAERTRQKAELELQVLALKEQVSALESREVCTQPHYNVETCGFCQRDAIAAQYEELRKIIDGGSESATHKDAIRTLEILSSRNALIREGVL